MPSKKELMKRIEELEGRLLQLENMHARLIDANSWQSLGMDILTSHLYTYNGKEARYCGRQLTADEIKNRHEHPLTKERTAWTKKISGVTHEELAQFVLDGKPIKRERESKVVYTSTYAPGTKTQSVKTDLGDISIQHDFKE
jgi:hypothetical protein